MNNDDWINVEDRLPTLNKRILVFDPFRESVEFGRLIAINPEKYYIESGKYTNAVKYWMPRPEFPKKK